MALTNQQLEAIVARAFPGERLREVRPAGERYDLALGSGQRLSLLLFATGEAAERAAAALRMLRAEIDLPIPQLHASDAEGATIGRPYALVSLVEGEPLEQALPQLSEDQRYTLGRRLGEVVCRVHRLACDRYGALAGAEPWAADDERGYVLARVADELGRCGALGLIDRQLAAEVQGWFEARFLPAGRQAALVCGGLNPQTILARRSGDRCWIGGLLGWEHALGWSPVWDHVTFFDTTEDPRFFSLRVGYGNAYDEHTQRAYEQVREHAMAPYRLLLVLQRMQEAHARSAFEECERRRGVLRGLLRVLAG